MRILTSLLFVLLLSMAAVASVGFVHEDNFTFGPFAPDVSRVRFVDYNNDGQRELLAVSDTLVVLWDIAGDSVIFSHATDTLHPHTQAVVGDFTDDLISDIVIVVAVPDTSVVTWPVATDWYLICFDGASGYLDSTFQSFHSGSDGLAILGTMQGDFMRSIDLDDDGSYELLYSYSSSYYDGMLWYSSEGGNTIVYDRFPDSVRWTRPFRTNQLLTRSLQNGSTEHIIRNYFAYVSELGPDTGERSAPLGSIAANGDFNSITPACTDTMCSGGGGFSACLYFANRTGELSSLHPGDELLATQYDEFECPWQSYWRLDRSLCLFAEGGTALSGQATLIWSVPYPSNLPELGNFMIHSNLPGYFFGIAGDTLFMFRGENGTIRFQTTAIPHGQRYWETNWPDSIPRLVVMNGNQVDIYSLDIATAVEDNPPTSLPNQFILGRPYPNPFNAETIIPIDLPTRGHLKLEIFNLLGQQVATLADREFPAGKTDLSWDATGHPSGIYLVGADFGAKTETRKLILLK